MSDKLNLNNLDNLNDNNQGGEVGMESYETYKVKSISWEGGNCQTFTVILPYYERITITPMGVYIPNQGYYSYSILEKYNIQYKETYCSRSGRSWTISFKIPSNYGIEENISCRLDTSHRILGFKTITDIILYHYQGWKTFYIPSLNPNNNHYKIIYFDENGKKITKTIFYTNKPKILKDQNNYYIPIGYYSRDILKYIKGHKEDKYLTFKFKSPYVNLDYNLKLTLNFLIKNLKLKGIDFDINEDEKYYEIKIEVDEETIETLNEPHFYKVK
ncbi:MAG: hypothetical protein ACPL1F_02315 [bacterium]